MAGLQSLLADPDSLACGVAHASFWIIALFELFVAIPLTAEGAGTALWASLISLGLFFWINIYGNFLKLCTTDSTTSKMILPALLQPGWRYCHGCEATAPPRSFHCRICRGCVLLRDHHCAFARRCVGLRNIRYFVCLLAYLSIAGFYCCWLNVSYLRQVSGGSLGIRTLFMVWFPLYSFFLDIPWYSFLPIMLCSITFLGSAFSFTYCIFTMKHLVKGHTVKEGASLLSAELQDMNMGLGSNLKLMFGRRWKLVLLCPLMLISSPLITDGTSYLTSEGSLGLKQM